MPVNNWSPISPPRPVVNGQPSGVTTAPNAAAAKTTDNKQAAIRRLVCLSDHDQCPRRSIDHPHASMGSAQTAALKPNGWIRRSAVNAPGRPIQLAGALFVAVFRLGSPAL